MPRLRFSLKSLLFLLAVAALALGLHREYLQPATSSILIRIPHSDPHVTYGDRKGEILDALRSAEVIESALAKAREESPWTENAATVKQRLRIDSLDQQVLVKLTSSGGRRQSADRRILDALIAAFTSKRPDRRIVIERPATTHPADWDR